MNKNDISQDSINHNSHTIIEKKFQELQKDKYNSTLQQKFVQSIKDVTTESEQLARELHKDDRYGNNQDYYDAHLSLVKDKAIQLALDNNFSLEEIKMVAIMADLHDAIEDGHISYAKLSTRFGKAIADAVEILNKREDPTFPKDQRILKKDYLHRISQHKITSLVKAADRMVNITQTTSLTNIAKAQKHLITYLRDYKDYANYNIISYDTIVSLLVKLKDDLWVTLDTDIQDLFATPLISSQETSEDISQKLLKKLNTCDIITYTDLLNLYALIQPTRHKKYRRNIKYPIEWRILPVHFSFQDVEEIEELLDSFYKNFWKHTN